MGMEKGDLKLGLVFLALSLTVIGGLIPGISEAWRRSTVAGDQFFTLGPRFFPYVACGLMILFSSWLTFSNWGRRRPEGPAQPDSSGSKGLWPVIVFVTLGVVYVVTLPYLGVLLATPVCLAVCFLYFGVRKWAWLVIFPLATTAVIVVAFESLLKVQLP